MIDTGEPFPLKELEATDPHGAKRYWLTTKVPLFDGDGAVSHVVTVSLDITERKLRRRGPAAGQGRGRAREPVEVGIPSRT